MQSTQLFQRISSALLIGTLSLLASCGGSDRVQFSDFVVIGASLTDTGNVSAATAGATPGAAPNYFGGRWSNGVLWIENVAANYGKSVNPSLLGGKNYAYGGAKTCALPGPASSVPDMCDQTTQYLAAVRNVADGEALYVIDSSSVGNEINTVIGSRGALATSLVTTTAPANVVTIMQRLYNAGARRFLVTNVPNVGATPLYISGLFAGQSANAAALSNGFNATLATSLNTFATANPNAVITRFDLFTLGATVAANPAASGLNNVTAACTLGAAPATICATPDTHFYWDSFHPTRVSGQILSNAVLKLL